MLRGIESSLRALVLLLLLCAGAFAQDSRATGAEKALHALFVTEWDYEMEQHPTWASTLGDRRWNDHWGDSSLDAIIKRHDHDIQTLAELTKIDRAALSAADQLNYDLFKQVYEDDIEGCQYRGYLLPLNQLGGVHTVNQLADALRFETVKDYEDWLARLKALPVRVDQTIALMRLGITERIIYPKVVLQRIPAQIDHLIVTDPQSSPLYKPFTKFSPSIATVEPARLAKAAQEIISSTVVPAYRKLKEFVGGDYLAAAWDQVGIWQLPNGAAMYGYAARHNTTTNLSPQQIHDIGLSEVTRIRAEMQAIIDKTGFRGSFTEFAKFLRTDPKFYFKI